MSDKHNRRSIRSTQEFILEGGVSAIFTRNFNPTKAAYYDRFDIVAVELPDAIHIVIDEDCRPAVEKAARKLKTMLESEAA